MANLSEGLVFGLGNPLLDISATVTPEFLKKWGLEANNAILAEDKHNGLDKEMIENFKVSYTAGGATQNSIRICQWILGKEKVCSFMGCIGDDFFGKCMQTKATEDGVDINYMIDKDAKTGHCCVLITNRGKSRSLCAYLGAANNFKKEFLLANRHIFERAKLYYVSGFHLTVSCASILEVAKYSNELADRTFCFNLSAPFISKFFSKELLQVIPYIDILFGNESEALAYAEMKGWPEKEIAAIAKRLANEEKANKNKPRLVVITQGHEPVIVIKQGDDDFQTVPVGKLNEAEIVDTNGAGDAFVGGFLAQYLLGKPLDKCIKTATYAAQQIIQQDGCSIPLFKPVVD